jgi:GLPGLI family protein
LYYFDFIFGDKEDMIFTLLNIPLLNIKLYVPATSKNLLIFSQITQENTIILSDEIKEIAGFTAKKAIIKSLDNNYPDFEVWYSDNFHIDNPNQNTPFNQIPGLLLEAEIIFRNITFKLIADKITSKNINDESFQIPSDYELASNSEIEELLDTVF